MYNRDGIYPFGLLQPVWNVWQTIVPNIGVCVTQVNEDLYDTHSHLNIVKSHPDETFYHELEDARIKYQLS